MAEAKEDVALLAAALKELERRQGVETAAAYKPYTKQLLFHNSPGPERMLVAGNQLGKTYSAAMETAYHSTGDYPRWWKGRRFSRAVTGWIGSISYGQQREAAQYKLLGTLTPVSRSETLGHGAIPKEKIIQVSAARGIADAVDTVLVRHKSGMMSTLRFKTYDQDIAKWAGGTVDFIWFDEEPPEKLYSEGYMRTTATKGIIYITFTPLLGRTPLVQKFTENPTPERQRVVMTAYEVADEPGSHITREEVDRKLAGLPEWEREARIYGRPAAGEGKIIKVAESIYVIPPVELKSYWPRVIGLDFGMLHPTAAVWVAWDRDRNRLLVYDEYRQSGVKISEHAGAMLLRGAGKIPVSWPQDGYQREKGTGESIRDQYKKLGLRMMPDHAQTGEAGESLWSSVTDLIHRLAGAQVCVFTSCNMLRDEIMTYHQKDGKINEVNDDLIAALRYAIMKHKRAVVLDSGNPFEGAFREQQGGPVARDLDVPPFSSLYGDR